MKVERWLSLVSRYVDVLPIYNSKAAIAARPRLAIDAGARADCYGPEPGKTGQ
jgi:hypothetical protein